MQAAKEYYAFDLAPKFWTELVRCFEEGQIFSVDRVKDEIDKGNDALKVWVNSEFKDAFLSTRDVGVLTKYQALMQWAQANPQFQPAAKSDFAGIADSWIIAHAMHSSYIVVTLEQPSPQSRKRVKIPDACNAFGVTWIGTFEMLRRLGIKLS